MIIFHLCLCHALPLLSEALGQWFFGQTCWKLFVYHWLWFHHLRVRLCRTTWIIIRFLDLLKAVPRWLWPGGLLHKIYGRQKLCIINRTILVMIQLSYYILNLLITHLRSFQVLTNLHQPFFHLRFLNEPIIIFINLLKYVPKSFNLVIAKVPYQNWD